MESKIENFKQMASQHGAIDVNVYASHVSVMFGSKELAEKFCQGMRRGRVLVMPFSGKAAAKFDF